jgi:hypothetical protein
MCGGRRVTTQEWLDQFFAEVTEARERGRQGTAGIETTGQPSAARLRELARVDAYLDRELTPKSKRSKRPA